MNYIALTQILWGVLLVYWTISAFNIKRNKYRKKDIVAVFYGLTLLIGFVLIYLPSQAMGVLFVRIIPFERIILIKGVVLTAIGIAFAIWARHTLGKNWSASVVIKEKHELIVSGPYKIVRHPIYSGILLGFLGTALVLGEIRGFIAFVLVFIGFWAKIKAEEKVMIKQFPKEYPKYMKKVKALIPYLL